MYAIIFDPLFFLVTERKFIKNLNYIQLFYQKFQ
jgi:hypothetical protein